MPAEPDQPALVESAVTRRGGRTAGLLPLLGVVLVLLGISCFALDVTEYGIVTRFGRVVRVTAEPGLHWKAPFDRVARLDRRLLLTRMASAEYLTEDKKNVVIAGLATWHIVDPERFVATLRSRADAEIKLTDLVIAETGGVLGRNSSKSLISAAPGAARYDALMAEIGERVAQFARATYGIEVVDVAIRELSLPEQNRPSVFERMKAERGKMAAQHRSAGELEAKTIIAKAEREKTHLAAEADAEAARISAEGEAEAMRIYAAALSEDLSFYMFMRTLQVYEKVLDEKTTLFLPADAELLAVLKDTAVAPVGERMPGREPRDELALQPHQPRAWHNMDGASDGAPSTASPEGAVHPGPRGSLQ